MLCYAAREEGTLRRARRWIWDDEERGILEGFWTRRGGEGQERRDGGTASLMLAEGSEGAERWVGNGRLAFSLDHFPQLLYLGRRAAGAAMSPGRGRGWK